MNKTIKIFIYLLILAFFPFFLINLKNCSLFLTIPIVMIVFYATLDERYPLAFIPAIIFYSTFTKNLLPLLFLTIGLTIILKMYILKKPLFFLIYTPFIATLINLIYMFLSDQYDIKMLLLNTLLSIILLSLLSLFMTSYKLKNKYIYKIIHLDGILVICFFITTASTFYLDTIFNTLEIKFLILSLPIIAFNFLKNHTFSFLFSFIAFALSFYILKTPVEISLLFFLIQLFTIYKWTVFILIGAFLLNLQSFHLYEQKLSYYIILFLASTEILRISLSMLPYFKKNDTTFDMGKNLNSNFCDQVIKFSSFLDDFSRNFIIQVEEKNRVNEAFNNLINSYCFKCINRYQCFGNDKTETYIFLKNCLMHGQDLHYKKNSTDIKDFFKKCRFTDEIIIKAHFLKNKYAIFQSNNPFEKTLVAQMTGISNTLRQYVLDIQTKEEIHINKFSKLKNELLNLNYTLILFNIKKSYSHDFLIEIGIDQADSVELGPILSLLALKNLSCEVSIENKENKDKTSVQYFSIIPKKNFNINYGYGQVAKDHLNIKGDNYLIKPLDNGSFFAALSDGMGHGINAYQESKMTISMIDKIIDFDINTQTSINILNTFYSLKDNFDNYATLDLIELHKNKNIATLYKMGSTFTYHVKNKEIITYANSNLPFGINDLIMVEELEIAQNDLIILMTDGITDSIEESKLKEFILLNQFKEPQKLTYEILQMIEKNNPIIKDDMSIIILKIETLKS